jgi:hypothetical protein
MGDWLDVSQAIPPPVAMTAAETAAITPEEIRLDPCWLFIFKTLVTEDLYTLVQRSSLIKDDIDRWGVS